MLNGESVDRVCAGDGVWSARALPGAPADSVSFAFILDLSSYSKLLFPHDAVAAVEDALIGLFADDEASSTDPLRAFVFLIRVEAHRDPVGLLASTPDVFVWCHPSIAGHDGDNAAAVYVTKPVVRPFLKLLHRLFIFIIVVMHVVHRDSQAQGNWMPGQSARNSKINVALHAQSNFSKHGFVAGSEITTAGIAAALRDMSSVGTVKTFAPFSYAGLFDERYVCAAAEASFNLS